MPEEEAKLKNKNLALLNKKPLIYYAIKKIIKNKLKYNCISSDNKKIINISKKYGMKAFFVDQKNFQNPTFLN